ncbi:TonB-dependent receptor [Allohahella marinimesophila]|uniref:TonB-dependent receptor plug domain-containing protein n=1 Tax=Allohahella marinimesophila TaxID=1054972 RepID=A0ABP7PID2_9GAMM
MRRLLGHKVHRYGACAPGSVHFVIAASALLLTQLSFAEEAPLQLALADLSLEELARMPVISVSKVERPVSEAAASVFVITNDDVRQSGAATLPEALRLAPNLQVARADARNYAISSRGFNNVFANKMLVMIDGRTVYSPFFSGVYWDAQDVMLEDLERVEVVSGPGGTLWGANAVNGVVNIVTRSAAETQGELVSLGASGEEQHAALRYGGAFPAAGHYRVYAKHSQHDDTDTVSGVSSETGWARSQTGFRTDFETGTRTLTVQGDAYEGRLHQAGTDDIEIKGANLLTRGSWAFTPGSTAFLQAYFDHTQRDQPEAFSQHLNTLDIELQHEWVASERHTLVWGGGYRYMTDRINNGENFAFLPDDFEVHWTNVFAQDEIRLTERLTLTVGSKFEENPFTGWEVMPSAQLAWAATPNQLVWASVSRAVRTPSRIDTDIFSPSSPPVVDGVPQYVIAGGPGFVSETAKVYELGYRSQPVADVSWSVTGFYSDNNRLRTLELNSKGPGLVFENGAKAKSYGVETWGSWQPMSQWRLHAGLVVQRFEASLKPGSDDLSNTTALASADPKYYGQIRSDYAISPQVTFNAMIRHVAELRSIDLPAYTALDARLAWQPRPRLELSLTAQNLTDGTHEEFGSEAGRSELERAFFGKLVWGL